jgi:hypothetical protein
VFCRGVVREIPVRPTANGQWELIAQTNDDGSPSIRSHPNKKPTRSCSGGTTPDTHVPWFTRENSYRDKQLLFVSDYAARR